MIEYKDPSEIFTVLDGLNFPRITFKSDFYALDDSSDNFFLLIYLVETNDLKLYEIRNYNENISEVKRLIQILSQEKEKVFLEASDAVQDFCNGIKGSNAFFEAH